MKKNNQGYVKDECIANAILLAKSVLLIYHWALLCSRIDLLNLDHVAH